MINLIKKILLFTAILFSVFSCTSGYKKTDRGIIVEEDSVIVNIVCVDDRTVHVQAYPKDKKEIKQSMVVNYSDYPVPAFEVSRNNGSIHIKTARLLIEYDTENSTIIFRDIKNNEIIVSEKASESRKLTYATIAEEEVVQPKQAFTLTESEAIYGLGQYQEGLMNYRGKTVKLVQANMEIVNPFLVSTRNYGILWDNYSKTIFTDNEDGASFWSEVADGINYYFVYGENIDDVIAGYRNLTGQVPMQPKSAFGFWQSKERYKSFAELTDVVQEYRKRQIPLDNIVQDWEYWGTKEHWNSMGFNPDNFDNAKEAIDRLHNEYNVKLTLSVWPGVGKKTAIYKSLDSISALFEEPTWAGYKVVDIYNPQARKVFWDYLYKGLYTKGVDAWWMDATEPSFREGFTQDKQEARSKSAGMTHIGSFHRYLNTYSLVLSEMMYENLRKQSNKRVSILTRSAFAGQQKYGTSVWSGDIYASWDVMAKQILAGLNFSMSGIPYWTSDIGAFYVTNEDGKGNGGYAKGLSDPAYLELYTRWFQFGAFSPIFRAHGTNVPREIWQFGKAGTPFYDAQLKMINMRYSLLSYIYSEASRVTLKGSTMMRALVMDFSNDENIYNNGQAYMFGSSLLVYPVLRPMFYDRNGRIANTDTSISIYLPKYEGNIWFDFNSDKCYQGENTIVYDAPLDIIPVFVKAGSIIPRNKIVQHANADDGAQIDIVIYAGNDASFTLYEDDNETYGYETGKYNEIDFEWNDKTKELSISHIRGNAYPKLISRRFNIEVIEPDTDGTVRKYMKLLEYLNKKQIVVIK